ncbi:innexin unc-7, partial [Clonorchis sinensis]
MCYLLLLTECNSRYTVCPLTQRSSALKLHVFYQKGMCIINSNLMLVLQFNRVSERNQLMNTTVQDCRSEQKLDKCLSYTIRFYFYLAEVTQKHSFSILGCHCFSTNWMVKSKKNAVIYITFIFRKKILSSSQRLMIESELVANYSLKKEKHNLMYITNREHAGGWRVYVQKLTQFIKYTNDKYRLYQEVEFAYISRQAGRIVYVIIIFIIDSVKSLFNTDASLLYNHDLFEGLIVKKRTKLWTIMELANKLGDITEPIQNRTDSLYYVVRHLEDALVMRHRRRLHRKRHSSTSAYQLSVNSPPVGETVSLTGRETDTPWNTSIPISISHRSRVPGPRPCSPRSGSYLAGLYLIVKGLYVINSTGQLFLVSRFLGQPTVFYGFYMLLDLVHGDMWYETGKFPRVTFCDFDMRRMGSNYHRHTLQCVLGISMFNEKIFIFLWFWLMVISLMNINSFLRWCFRIALSGRSFVKSYERKTIRLRRPQYDVKKRVLKKT